MGTGLCRGVTGKCAVEADEVGVYSEFPAEVLLARHTHAVSCRCRRG